MTTTTTITRSLLTLTLLGTSIAACGVNELPAYRSQITSMTVTALVSDTAELSVADPAVVTAPEEQTPGDAANAAMESYILTSLHERVRTQLDPRAVERDFGDRFAPDVSRGTGWRLTAAGAADLRVVAEVDGFGLDVDELGRATVYFRMTARAWLNATDKLVYESWSSHEVPLVLDPYGPGYGYYDDAAAMAAERAYNLMALDDLTDYELRNIVLDAADAAAGVLARQMVEASWE